MSKLEEAYRAAQVHVAHHAKWVVEARRNGQAWSFEHELDELAEAVAELEAASDAWFEGVVRL